MWGRGDNPPKDLVKELGEPIRSYGARAIFHPYDKHPIELLGDRQGCGESKLASNKPLLDWLNKVAMKKLLRMSEFNRLSGDSNDVVTLRDGQFVMEVSPQSSYGYLYIGAWQFPPADDTVVAQ
jgi:hypothetical protein